MELGHSPCDWTLHGQQCAKPDHETHKITAFFKYVGFEQYEKFYTSRFNQREDNTLGLQYTQGIQSVTIRA